MMPVNVFSALSTYGLSGEENYLTKSFVFLLKLLIQRMPDTSVQLLNRLTGPLPQHAITQPQRVVIVSQPRLGAGWADIGIMEAGDTSIYVEVKHDAPLAYRQLEDYFDALKQLGLANARLVLLTRSRASAHETTLSPENYHHVCWYEVYNWLDGIGDCDEVSHYFINDFKHFLEEKNMSLKKVTWEYIQGTEAISNLTTMMETAVKEVIKASFKRTAGWTWRGFYFDNYFFAIRFSNPLIITFENNMGNKPTAVRELDLEKTHFFALTKDEQFELIVDFLEKAKTEVPKGDVTAEPIGNA